MLDRTLRALPAANIGSVSEQERNSRTPFVNKNAAATRHVGEQRAGSEQGALRRQELAGPAHGQHRSEVLRVQPGDKAAGTKAELYRSRAGPVLSTLKNSGVIFSVT